MTLTIVFQIERIYKGLEEGGGSMFLKRIFVFFLRISLVMILLFPAFAQMKRVYKFKGVEIPFNLKYKDSVFKKGKYDLEFLKQTAQPVYHLRIIKRGKKLCLIPGV